MRGGLPATKGRASIRSGASAPTLSSLSGRRSVGAPFPGADSIFSMPCGAISRRLRIGPVRRASKTPWRRLAGRRSRQGAPFPGAEFYLFKRLRKHFRPTRIRRRPPRIALRSPGGARRVGRDRNAPLRTDVAGSAGAEHSPPSRFPGRPRRDPRGLTARECCQCVRRRAPQFSLRSVAPSLEAATATRDRSADTFAIIARVSISVEKLFSVCTNHERHVQQHLAVIAGRLYFPQWGHSLQLPCGAAMVSQGELNALSPTVAGLQYGNSFALSVGSESS